MISQPHTVGQQIRGARKALGWSLEKLASESGMSRSALSRIELDQQEASTADVDALAKVLGIVIVLGDVADRPVAAASG